MMRVLCCGCNPFDENVYLAWDEATHDALLVDPGFATRGEFDRVAGEIARRGLRLRLCLVTHCHYDHVMGLHYVAEAYPEAIVCGSQSEQRLMPDPELQARMFGLDYVGPDVPFARNLADGDVLWLGDAPATEAAMPAGATPADGAATSLAGGAAMTGGASSRPTAGHTLTDGVVSGLTSEPLAPGGNDGLSAPAQPKTSGHEIRVIDCPGHSFHGLCFYLPADGLLFSGDVLFSGSIGRYDFGRIMGCDGRSLISSIVTRLLTLPPETQVLPGHGPATTIGRERDTNPYF